MARRWLRSFQPWNRVVVRGFRRREYGLAEMLVQRFMGPPGAGPPAANQPVDTWANVGPEEAAALRDAADAIRWSPPSRPVTLFGPAAVKNAAILRGMGVPCDVILDEEIPLR
jgi:hypothetical protein